MVLEHVGISGSNGHDGPSGRGKWEEGKIEEEEEEDEEEKEEEYEEEEDL